MKYSAKDKVVCNHQDLGHGSQKGTVIGLAYSFDQSGKCTSLPELTGTPGDVYSVKLDYSCTISLVHESYMKLQGVTKLEVGQVAIYLETGATVVKTAEGHLLILKGHNDIGDTFFYYGDGSQTFAPIKPSAGRYYKP